MQVWFIHVLLKNPTYSRFNLGAPKLLFSGYVIHKVGKWVSPKSISIKVEELRGLCCARFIFCKIFYFLRPCNKKSLVTCAGKRSVLFVTFPQKSYQRSSTVALPCDAIKNCSCQLLIWEIVDIKLSMSTI